MPVKITKVSGNRYKVSTPSGTKGRNMTKANAETQRNLLNAVEHNPNFKPRKRKK